MKPSLFLNRFSLTIITLALLSFHTISTRAWAENIKTMAILPFTINSADNLSHIQKGIIHMLHSRLSWADKVVVIPGKEIKTLLSDTNTSSGNKLIHEIADKTNSNFVLAGSITELAGSFSIDAQVYDFENKQFMAFFEQSKISDDLIEKVDRMAATINKEVFSRATVTYEKMEQEKQAYINKLKRQNPENLMNVPAGWQEEKSPGWKIWKYLF